MNNNYKIIFPNKSYSNRLKFYHDINYFKNRSQIIFIYGIKILIIFILILQIKFQVNKNEELYIFKNDNKEINQINRTKNDKSSQKLFFNTTFLKNELHSYGLYNIFKYPFISLILIVNEKNIVNIIQLINQIKYVISQNFSDIEILLL